MQSFEKIIMEPSRLEPLTPACHKGAKLPESHHLNTRYRLLTWTSKLDLFIQNNDSGKIYNIIKFFKKF